MPNYKHGLKKKMETVILTLDPVKIKEKVLMEAPPPRKMKEKRVTGRR